MQRSDEKLCLQWNDFQDNVSSAFGNLREDTDFTDVTLACEDGQQVEAHKLVLISSGPFFLNLLKRNKHSHPLVYMRGIKYESLLSLVDFLYRGEANVYQDDLDSFLAMADELQLKGLDKGEREEEEVESVSKNDSDRRRSQLSNTMSRNNIVATSKDDATSQGWKNKVEMSSAPETAIALMLNSFSGNTNLEELDEKVKSMMTFSENKLPKQKGRARICKVCGKEGQMIAIMNHIEANHMTNISISCDVCGKTPSTRHALKEHKRINHSRSEPFSL